MKFSVKSSELGLKCAIGALTSSMLGIGILMYWPDSGFLEKVGIAACLSGIFHFLLHFPHLAVSNKWLTLFSILMILMTLAMLRTIISNTTNNGVKYDEEADVPVQADHPMQESELSFQSSHISEHHQASKQRGQQVDSPSKSEQQASEQRRHQVDSPSKLEQQQGQVKPSKPIQLLSSKLHVQSSSNPEQPSSIDGFDENTQNGCFLKLYLHIHRSIMSKGKWKCLDGLFI